MSQVTLEERVARLEKQFDDWAKTQLERPEPDRDAWMKTFGMFAGDATMKEIIEEGRRVREQDRQLTQINRP